MWIKKNRLYIGCTCDSFLYKRRNDAIIFTENKCYLIKKDTAKETKNINEDAVFLYKTSFDFEEITLDHALKLFGEMQPSMQMSTIEITYCAMFAEEDKKHNLIKLSLRDKSERFYSIINKFVLESNLKNTSNQFKIKI